MDNLCRFLCTNHNTAHQHHSHPSVGYLSPSHSLIILLDCLTRALLSQNQLLLSYRAPHLVQPLMDDALPRPSRVITNIAEIRHNRKTTPHQFHLLNASAQHCETAVNVPDYISTGLFLSAGHCPALGAHTPRVPNRRGISLCIVLHV